MIRSSLTQRLSANFKFIMQKLSVPFSEKDHAKSLGARWSTDKKTWYVPDGVSLEPFSQYVAGKARAGKILYVDMVPQSCFFQSVRSELTDAEWKLLKTSSYKRAGYCCEICGGKGPAHPVECHERWAFDESTGVQSLTALESLCPDCHTSTHMGLAQIRGIEQEAIAHMMKVNSWDMATTRTHIDEAFFLWAMRSKRKWGVDMTHLATLGVELSPHTLENLVISDGARTIKTPDNSDLPVLEWLLINDGNFVGS